MFTLITNLEKTLNQLKETERDGIKSLYRNVMKELHEEVEEFHVVDTFSKWVQENCAYRDTHKDPIEKRFWALGFQHTKWMCVEKVGPNDVFYYTKEGVSCCDARTKQIVACC